MKRNSWSQYWMEMARHVSSRATCGRLMVGCIIVRDNRLLSSGYNGAVRGAKHCIDVGCHMVDSHCARVVHAESNAVAQAARDGIKIEGATAVVTHIPCRACAQLLANAGVVKVIYETEYGSITEDELRELGLQVWKYRGLTEIDGRSTAVHQPEDQFGFGLVLDGSSLVRGDEEEYEP